MAGRDSQSTSTNQVMETFIIAADVDHSALSPTPPFPQETPRLRLAGVLVPAVAVGLLTTSAMFMKMTTAGIGFGFFGDPLIWRGLDLLNKNFPNWQKLLEIRQYVKDSLPYPNKLTDPSQHTP